MFIDSIGESQRMWLYGNDGAFTIIPNFLYTGIIAVLMSTLITIWSVFFIRNKYGANVLLLLFIALTLTGGGIGHIPFFLVIWLYARKINTSLGWWQKRIPFNIRLVLSKTWLYSTLISGILFLIGLEISVSRYVPNVSDPDQILVICWSFLFTSLILINYSYIAGFADDSITTIKAAW